MREPSGRRHGRRHLIGGAALATDPAVDEVGVEIGHVLDEATLRAPDVSVGGIADEPGYAHAAPRLAVEYAERGGDEADLARKVRELIGAGIDAAGRNAQFVLTGSHQFKLVERITHSLAGRVALAKLLPLSLAELSAAGRTGSLDLDEVIWRGGYPRAWSTGARPREVYLSYLETYVERDVRMLVNLKDADLFRRFVQLVAGRDGPAPEQGVAGA